MFAYMQEICKDRCVNTTESKVLWSLTALLILQFITAIQDLM